MIFRHGSCWNGCYIKGRGVVGGVRGPAAADEEMVLVVFLKRAMDHAVVGEGALIGARALVTEGTHIPPRTLWVGAPAKYKRDLTPDEIAWLKKSPGNYVKYSLQYINDGQERITSALGADLP